jgi:hypothetical protein
MGQAKFPVPVHVHDETDVIIVFQVIAQPLHSLTTKLPELIVQSIQEKLYGIYIVSVAFFQTNHVHGLNQICP